MKFKRKKIIGLFLSLATVGSGGVEASLFKDSPFFSALSSGGAPPRQNNTPHTNPLWNILEGRIDGDTFQLYLARHAVSTEVTLEERKRAVSKLMMQRQLLEEVQMALIDLVRLRDTPPAIKTIMARHFHPSLEEETHLDDIINYSLSKKGKKMDGSVQTVISRAIEKFRISGSSHYMRLKIMELHDYSDSSWFMSALFHLVRQIYNFSDNDEGIQMRIIDKAFSLHAFLGNRIPGSLLARVVKSRREFYNLSSEGRLPLQFVLEMREFHRLTSAITLFKPSPAVLLRLTELAFFPPPSRVPFAWQKTVLTVLERNFSLIDGKTQKKLLAYLQKPGVPNQGLVVQIFHSIPQLDPEVERDIMSASFRKGTCQQAVAAHNG